MIPLTLSTPSVAAAATANGSWARRAARSSFSRTGTSAAVSAISAVAASSLIPPQSA